MILLARRTYSYLLAVSPETGQTLWKVNREAGVAGAHHDGLDPQRMLVLMVVALTAGGLGSMVVLARRYTLRPKDLYMGSAIGVFNLGALGIIGKSAVQHRQAHKLTSVERAFLENLEAFIRPHSGKQGWLVVGFQRLCHDPLLPATVAESAVSRWARSTPISAGVTPEIREACPTERGRS